MFLAAVPRAAAGEYEILFFARTMIMRAVVDHGTVAETVMCFERCTHGARDRYNRICAGESGADGLPVWIPRRRRIGPEHGVPPRDDARMGYHDGRHSPRQRTMHVPVEVDQIGTDSLSQREKPVAGCVHVVPRIIHPLESVLTLG